MQWFEQKVRNMERFEDNFTHNWWQSTSLRQLRWLDCCLLTFGTLTPMTGGHAFYGQMLWLTPDSTIQPSNLTAVYITGMSSVVYKAKRWRNITYIVQQTTNCNYRGTLCQRHSGRAAYRLSPAHTGLSTCGRTATCSPGLPFNGIHPL